MENSYSDVFFRFLIVSDNFETILILYTGLSWSHSLSIITIHTGYYYLKKFKTFLMKNIFGIVGWSGSGKTDLVTRLINFLY